MENIDQFIISLNMDGGKLKNVWEKTQLFIDNMSLSYKIKKFSASETEIAPINGDKKTAINSIGDSKEQDDNLIQNQMMNEGQELEFDSIVKIVGYLDQRDRDIKTLVEFVENSKLYEKAYQKYLINFGKEILELKNKYKKEYNKKDRDDLLDGFLSKFLKIVRTNIFEDLYENIYRHSHNGEDDTYLEGLRNLIDEYMEKSGFIKRKIEIGDKFNSKACSSSESPVYTPDDKLHKTVKNIIWQPYVFHYFSYAEKKWVNRIIKGKVICYSSKIEKGE